MSTETLLDAYRYSGGAVSYDQERLEKALLEAALPIARQLLRCCHVTRPLDSRRRFRPSQLRLDHLYLENGRIYLGYYNSYDRDMSYSTLSDYRSLGLRDSYAYIPLDWLEEDYQEILQAHCVRRRSERLARRRGRLAAQEQACWQTYLRSKAKYEGEASILSLPARSPRLPEVSHV